MKRKAILAAWLLACTLLLGGCLDPLGGWVDLLTYYEEIAPDVVQRWNYQSDQGAEERSQQGYWFAYSVNSLRLYTGKYAAAIPGFQRILEREPRAEKAYMGLATAYLGQGDIASACQSLRQGYENTGQERFTRLLQYLEKGREITASDMLRDYYASARPRIPGDITVLAEDGSYAVKQYDAKNRLLRQNNFAADDSPAGYYTYAYDKAGNLTCYSQYDAADKLLSATESEYDEQGNCTRYCLKNGDNTLSDLRERDFDPGGQMLREKRSYYTNGRLRYYTVSQYDAAGQPVKIDRYSPANILSESRLLEYDSAGQLTRLTCSGYEEGALTGSYTDTYDMLGNVRQHDEYDSNKTLTESSLYEYDARGNISHKLSLLYYTNGQLRDQLETSFSSQGNKILHTSLSYYISGVREHELTIVYQRDGSSRAEGSQYSTLGTLTCTDVTERNAEGLPVSWTAYYYRADGTVRDYCVSEYDERGNEIRQTRYDVDGTMLYYHLSEYDAAGNYLSSDWYYPSGRRRY